MTHGGGEVGRGPSGYFRFLAYNLRVMWEYSLLAWLVVLCLTERHE